MEHLIAKRPAPVAERLARLLSHSRPSGTITTFPVPGPLAQKAIFYNGSISPARLTRLREALPKVEEALSHLTDTDASREAFIRRVNSLGIW